MVLGLAAQGGHHTRELLPHRGVLAPVRVGPICVWGSYAIGRRRRPIPLGAHTYGTHMRWGEYALTREGLLRVLGTYAHRPT